MCPDTDIFFSNFKVTDTVTDIILCLSFVEFLTRNIQEEIKSRLKLGNACYHSVQNLLSSTLLSKNLKIKIYRTIILPVVLYGSETWSLILREEHRIRVFENRVLRRIFVPKRDRVTGEWRKLHNEVLNLLKPTGHVMHQQFNSQQLYVLPTLYLCILYLSENKQRLVPLTA